MKILFSLQAAVLAIVLSQVGCSHFEPTPTLAVGNPKAVTPREFLYTPYEPLNQWLDTSARVQIDHVPLSKIFDEPVFRGLNYQYISDADDDPIVDIDVIAMTRRQLLWALAHDHKLQMSAIHDRQDESYIRIRRKVPTENYEGMSVDL